MQKPRVNIQKVVANTKSFLNDNQQGLFSAKSKEEKVEGQEFFTFALLSIFALIFLFIQNIFVLLVTLKDVFIHQIRTLTLKKAIHWGKLAVLVFLTCLLFKEEIGLSLNSAGIAFSANNGEAVFSGFDGINSHAPADPSNLNDKANLDYIRKFAPVAVAQMRQHNIPASISLAQALIESRAGRSQLATENNNHFGIKCFNRRCSKNHCSNYSDDHHKDFFRKYASPEQSWKDHSQFLLKERYQPLFQYGKDYRLWAKGLSEKGYATDKKYASKLIRVIEKYQLYSFDG